MFRRALPVLLCAVFAQTPSHAAESVAALSERLAHSADFRVRTQAALALGASQDKAAVEPLCAALEDANTTVRAAAAAGLGKLALGGKECLQARMDEEANASVKTVIEKALARLDGDALPAVSESTRYYVAIADTIDKTTRQKGEVGGLVRAALVSSAASAGGFAVAPTGETPADLKAITARFRQLRSYYLWPKVSPPEYQGGNLTIRFEISIFTYPGKALKGTIPLKLTMPDVPSRDVESENELIRMAAQKAFVKFTENVDRLE